jgi:hypothetical protein
MSSSTDIPGCSCIAVEIYPVKTLTDEVCFEQSGSAAHMGKTCSGAPLAKRKSQ